MDGSGWKAADLLQLRQRKKWTFRRWVGLAGSGPAGSERSKAGSGLWLILACRRFTSTTGRSIVDGRAHSWRCLDALLRVSYAR